MTGDAPFESLLVVGAGLLGTSVALAVRRRWPDVRLTAIDTVARAHAPFNAHLTPDAPLPAFDLAVLAVPVDAYAPWLRRFACEAPGRAVTDVGSVKRRPHMEATAVGLSTFAGGHPMAGGSRPGPEHASAVLFDRRPWFLTAGDAPPDAVAPPDVAALALVPTSAPSDHGDVGDVVAKGQLLARFALPLLVIPLLLQVIIDFSV